MMAWTYVQISTKILDLMINNNFLLIGTSLIIAIHNGSLIIDDRFRNTEMICFHHITKIMEESSKFLKIGAVNYFHNAILTGFN